MKQQGIILLLCLEIYSIVAVTYPVVPWAMQSSSAINNATGGEISTAAYEDGEWYKVTVPATVIAGLIQNNVIVDPFFGLNLQEIDPGQFDVPWWYRTVLDIPIESQGEHIIVTFKGINYKANVWFNGYQIGNITNVVGTFRYFDFDLTSLVNFGSDENVIAVEIYRPHDRSLPDNNTDTDLAITFVDWSPSPPDSNMGLWQEVVLSIIGPVSVRYPMVDTKLTDLTTAHLTVMAELSSSSSSSVSGVLTCEIPELKIVISKNVTIQPSSKQQVFLTNETYEELNLDIDSQQIKLWWPLQMNISSPGFLYSIILTFTTPDGVESDQLTASFGIREMTSILDNNGHRLYSVNGQPILIRGAGWSPDLFQRVDSSRLASEFIYMADMGLNTVRLEGKMESDLFFELSNSNGILTMPGWCCCDAWQHWDLWGPEQYEVAAESLRDQLKRLRIHPSVVVFMYSSDQLPPMDVEEEYLSVISSEYWPNPVISSANSFTSNITGPSGVKMSGPYSWVPPVYWLIDTYRFGGAYGFLTEGGPGEAPMTLESFSATVPQQDLWPMNEYWNYHCGNTLGAFGSLDYFTKPLYARYGNATSASDYLQKSQVAMYEGHRAMFEAYSRNKYTSSTGVIQWMLNNPWPEMIWHLYDWYLNPGGSYFGTKKACEPIHILYSYNDGTIWVVNSQYFPTEPLQASVELFNFDLTVLFNKTFPVDAMASDSSSSVLQLPEMSNLTETYFLRLKLTDGSSSLISENFYWLSTVEDVLIWNETNFFTTPCSQYSDVSMLQTLQPVQIEANLVNQQGQKVTYMVTNPTNILAFFIRLRVTEGAGGSDVLPVLWDDNYFTLLPGESREVSAEFNVPVNDPYLIVEIFNNISGGN